MVDTPHAHPSAGVGRPGRRGPCDVGGIHDTEDVRACLRPHDCQHLAAPLAQLHPRPRPSLPPRALSPLA
eukprot:5690362-Prymnesium_polylepis.1